MTIISIGLLIFNANIPSYGAATISVFGASMDVMVNAVCLALHWPFAQSWYKKICMVCPCHRRGIQFFVKMFKITPMYDQWTIKMHVANNTRPIQAASSDACASDQ